MEFKKLESVKKSNFFYYDKEKIIKNIDKLSELNFVRLWTLTLNDRDDAVKNVLEMYKRVINDFNNHNVCLNDYDLALINYMKSVSEEDLKQFDYYTNDRNFGYLMTYKQVVQDIFENNRPPTDLLLYCLRYLSDEELED